MEVFKSVCKRKLSISDEVLSEWQKKIEEQYSNRHYHNLNMIEKKMEVIREFTDDETLSCALIFASIFQYYHFDGKEDKVQDNCDEFKLFVEQAGIKDTALINRILRMLQDSTLTDDVEDFQDDVDIFKDLELVILGSSNEDYNQYTRNVEKEYSSDNDDSYKKDRLKMLKTLLMIPSIYSNQTLRDKYEGTARTNINMEIEELEKLN
ncbi:uncharacterized protein [Chironomus tepperi]|uniref:uncharacterized protein n=1 Tax=Chironomus tepperi TaxID=113505 RepID=UPI00391FC28C